MHTRTIRPLQSVLLLLAMLAPIMGCGNEAQEHTPAAERESVVLTTFYPTTYFARQIAGGQVPVECLVPEGEDPIFWKPSREALERYTNAELIVLNGAKFEKWAQRATLPRSRVVDSAQGFRDRFVTYEHAVTHSHGPGGEHSHEGTDGHTWLDPINAIDQSKAIAEAMAKSWPDHAGSFETNQQELERALRELHSRYENEVTPKLDGVKLLASHPAYNYLAERYGWDIHNLDLDPDDGLTEDAIDEINEAIGDHDGKVVLLWESEPNLESETEHAFYNVLFTPAELPVTGTAEADPDYMGIMHANIDRLLEAISD